MFFSGGVASWATAKRVVERNGVEGLVLLFADTKEEHPTTYTFLEAAAEDVGVSLTTVADGRDVWQVFFDQRMMGNTRVPICTRILKHEPSRRWLDANCIPWETTLYLGFDWTETDRTEAQRRLWDPWPVEAPLQDKPWISKPDLIAMARDAGLPIPVLYDRGFPHNNNGGACVKAGQRQWRQLLYTDPERYARWENNELDHQAQFGHTNTILRDRTGGDTKPLTLRAFRERLESGGQCDLFDWGGCCWDVTDEEG